ncbi:MAG: hypothetical protein M3Y85_07400 [Bacteroidota bacterium]|nr:hypothetical protein [Bacteroidota bacterium]
MPAIKPRLISPTIRSSFAGSSTGFCNTNLVLQKAVFNLDAGLKNSLFLRCDELPFVQCEEGIIKKTITQVLQLIADKKDGQTKLYLHVNAIAEPEEQSTNSKQKNLTRYKLRFHTNITLTKEWLKMAEQKLTNINALLLPYDGNLSVTQLKNSGCIFTMSVPGKL